MPMCLVGEGNRASNMLFLSRPETMCLGEQLGGVHFPIFARIQQATTRSSLQAAFKQLFDLFFLLIL